MSRKLGTFSDFAVAAKEYVHLMVAIDRLSSVTSALRSEQRRLGDAIHTRFIESGMRHYRCADLTKLEVRTTKRTTPLRRELIMDELSRIFDQTRAQTFWEGMESRRVVTETEKLSFSAG
jgi:hypothetical protein